jgi:hypothetical protein
MAFAMGWEILWPLILGFALSAVVQAVVSHREMARLLPDDRPRSIATALALGAASSSCSDAAVALARSLFRKGANFTAAMAFLIDVIVSSALSLSALFALCLLQAKPRTNEIRAEINSSFSRRGTDLAAQNYPAFLRPVDRWGFAAFFSARPFPSIGSNISF